MNLDSYETLLAENAMGYEIEILFSTVNFGNLIERTIEDGNEGKQCEKEITKM